MNKLEIVSVSTNIQRQWSYTTTVWAHTTIVWVNWRQNTTGEQLSGPHVYKGPPPITHTQLLCEHIQPLCGHSQPLCGLTDVKTLLENNLQGPMFIKVPPPLHNTHTTTVWAYITTVWALTTTVWLDRRKFQISLHLFEA